jgi:hypothetical protein
MLTHALRPLVRDAARPRPRASPLRPLSPPSLLDLQPLLGNRAVQSLLAPEPESPGCACGGTCAHCAAEREDKARPPLTGPSSGLDPEEIDRLIAGMALSTPGTPLMPLTPVPPTAAGTVICKGGAMEVWISPTETSCVAPCERRHEEKHIADFQADPDYKDICKGIPDGETFTYKNSDDARRFETAATDVEIACLNAAIPGASAACKPEMIDRRDNTLPAYKRSFESKSC